MCVCALAKRLAGLFSTLPLNFRAPSSEAVIPFFKVSWYNPTRGMNPRSIDCEADALINALRHRDLEMFCIERSSAPRRQKFSRLAPFESQDL